MTYRDIEMRLQGVRGWGVLGCLTAMASVANALPIDYRETRDGELGGDQPPIFSFQLGTNQVTGESRSVAGVGVPADQWQFDSDGFYFTVPDGARIDGIRLSWGSTVLPETLVFAGGIDFMWILDDEVAPITERRDLTLDFRSNGVDLRPFDEHLAPSVGFDSYRLFMLVFAATGGPPGQLAGGRLDYTWGIDVGLIDPQPVPESGTLGLLGLGVLGMVTVVRPRVSRPA